MSGDLLGPIMFVCVFALIFSGYPVAFSLGGTALIFAAIGVVNGYFDWGLMLLFSQRLFGIMNNFVLLAVPFFILMGAILEKSKLAEDLLTTIGRMFGRVRGGLALAVVMVGTLLAAATGVVGASVTAMGVISMPVMLRHGYSKALASGVICASGTLGQIIPPSVVLVVLADQLGISVGDLFLGALPPGLMLATGYALYVFVYAWLNPDVAPPVRSDSSSDTEGPLLWSVLSVLFPPLILIITVLGSIFAGIATPTEAGALGAVGALLLALINRRFSRQMCFEALDETVKLTSMIVFLLVGSTAFALVFRGLYGHIWIEDLLQNLPGGAVGLILFSNAIVFVLGFFIDFFEIAFIILPILLPVAKLMGIDLVWFGVLLGINLQTSFLTPPFGFSLFYLRGVVDKVVETKDMYRGVVPFIGIQAVVLAVVFFFPEVLDLFVGEGTD
ncbi:MAG: TRAP transporter large permease subunit [Myxococcota bacterium]|nr:TRAP transporter large permease subunit [Myxococcota bacterium]